MIWPEKISFEGFQEKINDWYKKHPDELCDPPIDAQFALDLIFKTLIDDKENYSYLTTISESEEQTNSIMLDIILTKYSRKYRKFKKRKNNKIKGEKVMDDICIKDCKECSKKYQFPFGFCCLIECGEHEFCKGCDKGIYLKGEKDEFADICDEHERRIQ